MLYKEQRETIVTKKRRNDHEKIISFCYGFWSDDAGDERLHRARTVKL
jgi:hypothetical protein